MACVTYRVQRVKVRNSLYIFGEVITICRGELMCRSQRLEEELGRGGEEVVRLWRGGEVIGS